MNYSSICHGKCYRCIEFYDCPLNPNRPGLPTFAEKFISYNHIGFLYTDDFGLEFVAHDFGLWLPAICYFGSSGDPCEISRFVLSDDFCEE